MRMLLVEAAQVAVRCDPQMRNEYLHRCHTKAKGVAKVAAARKLAIRLYWMLRTNTAYPEVVRDRKSTRLNSSHLVISYAVFCLKKKNIVTIVRQPREHASSSD